VLARDFAALANLAELDSNMMHSVMITSSPPLIYWTPETIRLMHAVVNWRSEGLQVFYTIDAGPNVHCLCPTDDLAEVSARLMDLPGVKQVLTAPVGGAARLVPTVE
jgi:diphosphomevalonate decarboxylase